MTPDKARYAVDAIHQASRKAPMPAALHELVEQNRDALLAFISEAEANAKELAELKQPKEAQP